MALILIANVGLPSLFVKEMTSRVSALEPLQPQKPLQSQKAIAQKDLIANVGLLCPHAKAVTTYLVHVVHQRKQPHRCQPL